MPTTVSKPLDRVVFWLESLYLFTRSDLKNIFMPTLISAYAASPSTKVAHLLGAAVWLWLHILQCDVSNQRNSMDEDLQNKPWRPLPSGRISQTGARRLRWALLVFCLCLSAWHSRGVVISSAILALLMFLYDDVGFSYYPILKNLMNMGGYVGSESGSIMIMSSKNNFDQTSLAAVLVSGLLILTTIHAQDFADVEGDKKAGRLTLPIVAPEGSRVYILAALPIWSIALAVLWELGPLSATLFVSMGAFTGSLYFRFRDVKQDEKSFVLYNVWLVAANILPLNARRQVFRW